MAGAPLLVTKIELPRVRPGHVRRGALTERLERERHRRLTLVVAPAGWGKTSLLTEWIAEADVPAGWVSLDEDDNDPVRFWTYVAAALRQAGIDVPQAFEAAVTAPGTSAGDVALPVLINALAASQQQHVLVLDDYHLIREPAIHDCVRFLLTHLPRSTHLAVATRVEPPIGVARLRARGELDEIAFDQLRFNHAEAEALLNDTLALALPEEDLQRLSSRTEGWAAGLYLAGLSLRDRPAEGAGALGYDRHLVDYLGDEVLSAQTLEAREFLVETCVLDRFCAALCDAVRDDDSSRTLLTEIARENLFLVPLDDRGEWFRYHRVFRDVLTRELAHTRSDEQVGELRARAAAWSAAAGDTPAAVTQLLAAGHTLAAGDLIASSWNRMLQYGRSATLLRWLDALPPEAVIADPRLCLARAWLALDSGEQAAAQRWAGLTEAADDGRELPDGGATIASGVAMLRATVAYRHGDLKTAEELGGRAVALERLADTPWRAVALATLGAAMHFRGAAAEEVVPLLEEAVANEREGRNSMAVLRATGTLAAVTFAAGDFERAQHWVAAADELRRRQTLEEYWMGSLASAVAGRLAAERGELETARALLERGLVLGRRGDSRPEQIYALAVLAPVLATLGEPDAATDALRDARQALKGAPSPGMFAHLLNDVERRLRGRAPAGSSTEALSEREMSVLRLLGSELSTAEIGDQLYISRNTVKTHVRAIYRKLDADTRALAVARARELRLL
jgi:LuxR family maltose regulon positive regulatory protein